MEQNNIKKYMRNYKIKKLFKETIASVRSNTIDKCLKKKEGLKITYRYEIMTLSYEDLINKKFQIVKKPFMSKYGTGLYYLIDFQWRPDK